MNDITFTNFCKHILNLDLTPSQSVIAKICFDQLEYDQLNDNEKIICRQIFGSIFETGFKIPSLARRQIVLRLGRSSGKSLLASAYALYRMVTANIDQCGPGDMPTFMVVAPVIKLAEIAFNMAKALVEQSNHLINYIKSDKAGELVIKRPTDDVLCSLMVITKSKGGTNLRGRSIIDLLIDESEFMPAEDASSKVTDKDVIAGAAARIIKSGKIILISTPYPTPSVTADLFEKNYNNPKTAIIALGSTLTMRGDEFGISEMIEIERARDPVNAMREYDCIATNATGGFFDTFLIEEAIKPIEYLIDSGQCSAGIDLGFAHDCSAQVITQRQGDKVVVINTLLLTPQPKIPLKPTEVMSAFASLAKQHNCNMLATDQHYYHVAVEYGALRNVQVVAGPRLIEHAYIYLRDLFKEGKIIIPNNPELIRQLKSVLFSQKPNNTGIKIILPKGNQSGHTDLVSALVQAVYLDKRFGPIGNSQYINPLNKYNKKSYHNPFQGFVGNGGMEKW